MITALWSDQHFGHKNIIEYAQRPFNNVYEMDTTLIKNYNELISEHDTVVWLGDAFLCPRERALEIMNSLNGHKMLVMGNHDKSASAMLSLGFDVVVERMMIQLAGKPCLLCHYPYAGANRHGKVLERASHLPERKKGEILIHGHTHSHERVNGNMIHVGVDSWDMRPVLIGALDEVVSNL